MALGCFGCCGRTPVALTHGPIIGEVAHDCATIWVRGVAAPAAVEVQLFESATGRPAAKAQIDLSADRDNTGQAVVAGLRADTRYDFTVGNRSGCFRTPPEPHFQAAGTGGVCTFAFGSCIGGQNYGRHPDNGFEIFDAVAAIKPDFLHINGDSIYADDVLQAVSTSPWNAGRPNVLPAESDGSSLQKAETLADFRCRYRLHLEDPAYAKLLASTAVFNTWDDHEIADDWGAKKMEVEGKGQVLENGRRAFFEYWPLSGPPSEPHRVYRRRRWGPHVELLILDCRSYRGMHTVRCPRSAVQAGGVSNPVASNDAVPQLEEAHAEDAGAPMLGRAQHDWLLRSLLESTATWKFICSSVPLSFPTGWPRPEETGYDGWSDGRSTAAGTPGEGAEAELLAIMQHCHDNAVRNIVFISGDVHFPFAASYDPFGQGEALCYEVGATPFSALCLPPPESGPDETLNPTLLFVDGQFASELTNFGVAEMAEDGVLTMSLRDRKGDILWTSGAMAPKS